MIISNDFIYCRNDCLLIFIIKMISRITIRHHKISEDIFKKNLINYTKRLHCKIDF